MRVENPGRKIIRPNSGASKSQTSASRRRPRKHRLTLAIFLKSNPGHRRQPPAPAALCGLNAERDNGRQWAGCQGGPHVLSRPVGLIPWLMACEANALQGAQPAARPGLLSTGYRSVEIPSTSIVTRAYQEPMRKPSNMSQQESIREHPHAPPSTVGLKHECSMTLRCCRTRMVRV